MTKNKKDTTNIKKIIENLNTIKNNFCRVRHKRGWLGYLRDGDTVFTPQELKDTIEKVINNNPPKGDKLFDLSLSKH